MQDKFLIDHHKLMFHPERVAQWRAAGGDWEKEKKVYPLYVEISPSGNCNHRCSFCAVDYIGYKPIFLGEEALNRTLREMAANGVKSVMLGGEGEPLLMKGLGKCIRYGKSLGLDFSITTNATPLNERFLEEAMASVSWIKASVNAGEASAYSSVHGAREGEFERVMQNLENAARFRRERGLRTALGAQAVLIPENAASIPDLCARAKRIGLDYVVVKPYSQHLKSEGTMAKGYKDFDYRTQSELARRLEEFNDDSFQVIFRWNTMNSLSQPRYYHKCYATPSFWAYVMASGDVYSCSAYLLDERFRLGNVKEKGFSEIWESENRRRNLELVRKELDIGECRRNCRMEHVNRYLWDLKNPNEHVNFI